MSCHSPEGLHFNYTYNASKMWYACYPDSDGMVDIDGMTGSQAYGYIYACVEYLRAHKEDMLKLEPRNGWGSYDGFLEFLWKLHHASVEHLDLIWRASR